MEYSIIEDPVEAFGDLFLMGNMYTIRLLIENDLVSEKVIFDAIEKRYNSDDFGYSGCDEGMLDFFDIFVDYLGQKFDISSVIQYIFNYICCGRLDESDKFNNLIKKLLNYGATIIENPYIIFHLPDEIFFDYTSNNDVNVDENINNFYMSDKKKEWIVNNDKLQFGDQYEIIQFISNNNTDIFFFKHFIKQIDDPKNIDYLIYSNFVRHFGATSIHIVLDSTKNFYEPSKLSSFIWLLEYNKIHPSNKEDIKCKKILHPKLHPYIKINFPVYFNHICRDQHVISKYSNIAHIDDIRKYHLSLEQDIPILWKAIKESSYVQYHKIK